MILQVTHIRHIQVHGSSEGKSTHFSICCWWCYNAMTSATMIASYTAYQLLFSWSLKNHLTVLLLKLWDPKTILSITGFCLRCFFIFPIGNPPWLGNRWSEDFLFFGNPESANPAVVKEPDLQIATVWWMFGCVFFVAPLNWWGKKYRILEGKSTVLPAGFVWKCWVNLPN